MAGQVGQAPIAPNPQTGTIMKRLLLFVAICGAAMGPRRDSRFAANLRKDVYY